MEGTKIGIGIQLHVSGAQALIEEIAPVVNDPDAYYRQKPKGGLWTSSWNKREQTSGWVEWCRSEDFGNVEKDTWWLLTPRPDCRIYTIDSMSDFKRCLMDYGCTPPIARVHPIFAEKRSIDFERLARDYDGVRLTERGNRQTHLSHPNDLNAWDCESTVWFHWCFERVERFTPMRQV